MHSRASICRLRSRPRGSWADPNGGFAMLARSLRRNLSFSPPYGNMRSNRNRMISQAASPAALVYSILGLAGRRGRAMRSGSDTLVQHPEHRPGRAIGGLISMVLREGAVQWDLIAIMGKFLD